MMDQQKRYPGKLLLFGEYVIMNGGDAIVLPYPDAYGQWAYDQLDERLLDLALYMQKLKHEGTIQLDVNAFMKDVKKGLTFHSNIKNGYGLGSSGALCAAIYDTYALQPADNDEALKEALGAIESFFHGQSSGLDPYTSYKGEAYARIEGKYIALDPVLRDQLLGQIHLFDSGGGRQTKFWVDLFNNRLEEEPEFKHQIDQLNHLNSKIVRSLLENGVLDFSLCQEFSLLQFKTFNDWIPDQVKARWQSLENTNRCMKLCGAGGGGYFIEISQAQ